MLLIYFEMELIMFNLTISSNILIINCYKNYNVIGILLIEYYNQQYYGILIYIKW